MLKKDLRKKYSQKRKAISPQDLTFYSKTIANSAMGLPIWDFKVYHLFLAIAAQKEVDTSFIISSLFAQDKTVVVPKICKNILKSYQITQHTDFVVNPWGIPEPVNALEMQPKEIDAVFIPLFAYDKKGHRVGYGKGFYDQFLKSCRKNVIKIGLSFFEVENEEIEDVDRYDVPLDFCISPKNIYTF